MHCMHAMWPNYNNDEDSCFDTADWHQQRHLASFEQSTKVPGKLQGTWP